MNAARLSRARRVAALAIPALVLAGCRGIQSVLEPHGPNADGTAAIGWVLFIGAALIFFFVAALAACALWAAPQRRAWLARKQFIFGAGIVFPAVALVGLLAYTLTRANEIDLREDSAAVRIEVVAEMWWWRVHYLDRTGAAQLVTANEIHMPVGRTIELSLKSPDVIHSFWVPSLAGKLDMIPGRTNVLRVRAHSTGIYRGQCAEYCGMQHAKMAFYVVARPAEEFERWFAAQREPAAQPASSFAARGAELFLAKGCGECHAVRGTRAAGVLGPDLTHVGSRASLAAGILPNNAGTLAGWIAASQDIKPGNRMPSFFSTLAGEELRALAVYLESLQ
jgi:cytochrome c oxidase subunit II